MSDDDLKKEAAETVMGWHFSEVVWSGGHRFDNVYVIKSNHFMSKDKWNPITNANHTKMLKDKAVEMGVEIVQKNYPIIFDIAIFQGFDCLAGYAVDPKDELRTTTQAIIEVLKKLRDQ